MRSNDGDLSRPDCTVVYASGHVSLLAGSDGTGRGSALTSTAAPVSATDSSPIFNIPRFWVASARTTIIPEFIIFCLMSFLIVALAVI